MALEPDVSLRAPYTMTNPLEPTPHALSLYMARIGQRGGRVKRVRALSPEKARAMARARWASMRERGLSAREDAP